MDQISIVQSFDALFLIEFATIYYMLNRKISSLKINRDTIKELLLLNAFKSIVDFVASDEIIEQGIIGSTLDMKDKQFVRFIEDKIKKISQNVKFLSDSITLFEKFEEKSNKIIAYCNDIKYMMLVSMLMLVITLVPLDINFNILILGFVIGLEIVGMYYTVLALTLYHEIRNYYSKIIGKE